MLIKQYFHILFFIPSIMFLVLTIFNIYYLKTLNHQKTRQTTIFLLNEILPPKYILEESNTEKTG